MACPLHHIHTVKRLTDYPLLTLIRCFCYTELTISPLLQVVQNVEHAHQKRARTAGRVEDCDIMEAFTKCGPEISFSYSSVRISLLIRLQSKHELVEQFFSFIPKMVCQVVCQREAAHQVNLGPGGIKDTCLTTLVNFLGYIDQAFINFAYHLGVNGYLLIERAILGDGEVVALQESYNLLEAVVGNSSFMLMVKPAFGEQTAVEIRRQGKCLFDFGWEMAMTTVELIVKGFKEKHSQPVIDK